uniref:C-type LECtin n=1 Tax=Panagrolaimus sp. JU765 TaxID=591449 RepID=A0AC34QYL9_9BILA
MPTTTLPVTTYPPNVCPPTSYYDFGQISSPGFPTYNYGNELNCTYILQALNGYVINIVFGTVELNKFDTIQIYDGPSESSAVLDTLSGTYLPNSKIVQSTGIYMTLRFLTDSIATAAGFSATFNSVVKSGSTTLPPTRICSDGWIHDQYERYCYKYFANGGVWEQNLQSCGSFGAQLLTIHDGQQEFDVIEFIKNMQGTATSDVWIGLKKVDGSWQWSDGTAVNYLAFLSGEPSAAGSCAAIRSFTSPAGWLAVNCNTALPYICYHNALSFSDKSSQQLISENSSGNLK